MINVCHDSIGSSTGTVPNSLGGALRELSQPWGMGDKIKVAIERAAHRAGLTYWRAFDIWYGKARSINPIEAAAIEEALHEKRTEERRNEAHELRLRLERMEAMLAQSDPDFRRAPSTEARDRLRSLTRNSRAHRGSLVG